MHKGLKRYIDLLTGEGRVSVPDELDIEYLIRSGCEDLLKLEALYEKYRRKRDQLRRDRNAPTTQEQNKKRSKIDT